MRKLDDPILNDLILMVQGRRYADLTSQATSRYIQHLDRIDAELKKLRNGGPAPGFHDELTAITHERLAGMTGELEQLRATLVQLNVEGAAAAALKAKCADLEAALFEEFGPELAEIEAESAVDAALALLRLFKAKTAAVGLTVTTPTVDLGDKDATTPARRGAGRR